MERRLRPDEVAMVLRRAAELDATLPAPGGPLDPLGAGPGVEERAVLEAAEEAGFSPDSVSTALAELRAGALDPASATGLVADQRVLPGDAATVARSVERLLDRERFSVRRRDGERVVWVRGPRSWSDVLRLRRGLDLGVLAEVAVTVAPFPGGSRSLVRVETVRDADPSDAPVSGALGAGIGLAAGAAAWAATADPAWLVAAIPAGGVLGVWRWRESHREAARHAAEVADGLSRLLDAVDRT